MKLWIDFTGNYSNDLYQFNPSNQMWTQLSSHGGDLPSPRKNAGFAPAGSEMLVLFGGLDAVGTLFIECWIFHMRISVPMVLCQARPLKPCSRCIRRCNKRGLPIQHLEFDVEYPKHLRRQALVDIWARLCFCVGKTVRFWWLRRQ